MKNRCVYHIFIALVSVLSLSSCSRQNTRHLVILETTDIHGMIFPYDYIEQTESKASLASVAGYIKQQAFDENEFVLLDNGDNLQGQPTVYYYNFEDTVSPHLLSQVMNYMEYDATTAGNHDIEAGHSVYDRIRKEYKFPMLAANAVDIKTGEPYFEPYTVLKKNGLKIIVFGLVTSSIPEWIPPELYSGIKFEDMVKTAEKWMPRILNEKPDIVIGLFHSGWDKGDDGESSYSGEDESNLVAFKVPGFNVIFTGHDHATANEKIVNTAGDTVLILDGGSRAEVFARADIEVTNGNNKGKKLIKTGGKIITTSDYPPDREFLDRFSENDKAIRKYVDKVIGESSSSISSRDSYFGPSAFTSMIHSLQLEITGAEISFAAPLSFDVEIPKGQIRVSDMFKLYRFENMLYTMQLSGEEILKYLEYSYSGWLNTMKGPDDHLINFRTDKNGKVIITGDRARLRYPSYNFDSAAGIDYTVDIRKPAGERVEIKSFSDGRTFNPGEMYKVAINSYRGSGGGGHLTEGAGLSKDELGKRLVTSTERDLRYYMIKSIESKKLISPSSLNNWKIIPAGLAEESAKRDYRLMFGNSN